MIFMSAISVVLLIFFCYVLMRSSGFDRVVGLALGCKILAGIGLGLIYKFYYQGGDTFEYFAEAAKISDYMLARPGKAFTFFIGSNEFIELFDQLRFSEQPRALFFAKVVSGFYLLSGGSYWLISMYFSLICFSGIYLLVSELQKSYPGLKKAARFSFFFLPTFVFWTSGLLKESIAIAALCISISVVAKLNRTRNYQEVLQWILLLLACWLLWKLKYYYAAVALNLLFAWFIYRVFDSYGRWKIAVMMMVLVGSAYILSMLHYNLNISRVLDVIYKNYQASVSISEGSYIRYYGFDGRLFGFIINLQVALFGGLFRPLPGEPGNLLQVLVSLENLMALILFIVAIWQSKFQWQKFLSVDLIVLLVYIFTLATLLAYASPNFGTLSRYKVGYWPFFVFVVLAFFFKKQKGRHPFDAGL
jgi:hypothetical protein